MSKDKTGENNPYYSWIEYVNTNREIFFSNIRNMQGLWDKYWKLWSEAYNKKPNPKEP